MTTPKKSSLCELETLLSSQITDELKQPVQFIIEVSEKLSQGELSQEQSYSLRQIREAAGILFFRMNNLVDLKTFPEVEPSVKHQNFSLRNLLAMLEGVISLKASLAGSEFALVLKEDVPEILEGDPQRLGQVILNLVERALKFSPSAGILLLVSLEKRHQDQAIINFYATDSGANFHSPIDLKIESADDAHQVMLTQYGDSGLELALSYKIIAKMGGRIAVKSVSERGSVVYLSVPFTVRSKEEKQKVDESADSTSLHSSNLHSLKILVVDDNSVNRKVLEKLLLKRGHSITSADNGLLAVSLYEKHHYDLILMDLHMPIMDGYEATEKIRKIDSKKGKNTPVVAVTTLPRDECWAQCLTVGFTSYVQKPFTFNVLWETVGQCLNVNPSPA